MTNFLLVRLGLFSVDLWPRPDRLALLFSLLAIPLVLAAAAQDRTLSRPRRWLPLLGATVLTILGSNWLLMCAGWSLTTLCMGPRVADRRGGGMVLRLARGGDLSLFLSGVLLFFALGGSWSQSGRFLLDQDPERPLPQIVRPDAPPLPIGPTLAFREIEAQIDWRDEQGSAPVAEALQGKLLYGAPLLPVLGGAILATALSRAILSAAVPGPFWALLLVEAMYLIIRLKGLLVLCPQPALAIAVIAITLLLAAGAMGPVTATLAALSRLARLLERRFFSPATGATSRRAPERPHRSRGLCALGLLLAAPALAMLGPGIRSGGPRWLLPALLLSPLLAAAIQGAAPIVARAASALPLLFSFLVLACFNHSHGVRDGDYGVQLGVQLRLVPPIELHLGIDGLSVTLLPLCALLCTLALFLSANLRQRRRLLLLLSAVLLFLCALDAVLLCGSWLAVLGVAGAWLAALGPAGVQARRRLLYASLGGAFLIIVLGGAARASVPTALSDGTRVAHSLDIIQLAYLNHYGHLSFAWFPLSKVLFALVLLAFAPAAALFPLHGWLPRALAETPAALLPAFMLRTAGFYGLLRVGYGLFPDVAVLLAPTLSAFGAAAAVHGALCLHGETDGVRSVGHAQVLSGGLCLLGAASFTLLGLSGLLLLLFAQLGLLLFSLDPNPAARALIAPLGLGGLSLGPTLVLWGALPAARPLTLVAAVAVLLQKGPRAPGSGALFLRRTTLALCLFYALCPSLILRPARTALGDLITHTSGHIGAAALALRK